MRLHSPFSCVEKSIWILALNEAKTDERGSDHIFDVQFHLVLLLLNSGSSVVILALTATFDTVIHDILISHLETSVGVRGRVLKNRTFRVFIGDSASSSTSLSFGVPQGSVFGPLLFCLYLFPLGSIHSRAWKFSFIYLLYQPLVHCRSLKSSFNKVGMVCSRWAFPVWTFLVPVSIASWVIIFRLLDEYTIHLQGLRASSFFPAISVHVGSKCLFSSWVVPKSSPRNIWQCMPLE